jgi:CheY-like chemotaxis protein
MAWRVLVADDDPEICTLIKTILRSASFEVEVCADAESALVHLQRDKPYDILISDFMLPGISGIELITMVRSNPQTARLPILMISGHSNYAMDARARSAGADHFLNKPFTLTQLRSTVSALAAKYRPLTAAEEAKIAAAKPGGAVPPPGPSATVKINITPPINSSGAIKVSSSAPLSDTKNRPDSHSFDANRAAVTLAALFKVIFVAISLGLDVFAVSVGVGMRGTAGNVKLRIGLAFTTAEVSMTCIGAALGALAGRLIGDVAGYFGFVALIGVGIYMVIESSRESQAGGFDLSRGWGLLLGALSISLDSLGIGFSINYIGVPLLVSLICIAVVAATSTTLGLTIGKALGAQAEASAGKWAGIILILTGVAFTALKVFSVAD